MAYAVWNGVVTDDLGNVVPGAQVTVRDTDSGALARLYTNRDGSTPKGNPFFTDANGQINFFVPGGAYTVTATSGTLVRSWQYVAVGTAAEFDVEGLAEYLNTGVVYFPTKAAMISFTPTSYPAAAGVLRDAVGSNNGFYTNNGNGWVFAKAFPDTFARLDVVGGDENDINAELQAGVNPSTPLVLYMDVAVANTGPVTLSVAGIGTGSVRNVDNSVLSAGEFFGRQMLTRQADGTYRMMIDPSAADRAVTAAQEAIDAAQEAIDAVAQVNLPPIEVGDEGKALVARSDLSGYELADVEASSGIFDNKAAVTATTVSDSVHAIRLNGSASVGDGLGGLYVDTDNGSTDTVASGDGRTWYRSPSYLEGNPFKNCNRFNVLFRIPGKFNAYDSLVATQGYTSFYASGHFLDYKQREIWVVWAATGGDSANWFVVYDMDTLSEKTYFKAGIRWSKCFSIVNRGASRKLLTTAIADRSLAEYNVTSLPLAGSAITPDITHSQLDGTYVSAIGDTVMSSYNWVETNTTITNSTFIKSNLSNMATIGNVRISPSISGSVNGDSSKLYKSQGVAIGDGFLLFSYGGLVGVNDTDDGDFRKSKQGVSIVSQSGDVIASSLFSPYKAMRFLEGAGYIVSRFEHEGVFYSQETSKITTIWHYGDRTQPFLIVEAFSGAADAFDFSSFATDTSAVIPIRHTLLRASRGSINPAVNPSTGEVMSNISEVIDMMDAYGMREVDWYSSNIDGIKWFDGSDIPQTHYVNILRGNNASKTVSISNKSSTTTWGVSKSGSTNTLDGPYIVSAYKGVIANKNGVSQAVPSNSNTKITFDNVLQNSGGVFNASLSRITPKVGEIWDLRATVQALSGYSAGDLLQLFIYRNGNISNRVSMRATGGGQESISISITTRPTSGSDYYEFFFNAQNGCNIQGSGGQTWIDCYTL